MASMALSTVACAVIIRICGRSPSGVAATSSRISSRPVRSGIRLSTTSRSKGRSASSRCASRGLVVATHSWPSSRRARPSALRIFSSSSTSRMEPWAHQAASRGSRAAARPGRSMRTVGALRRAGCVTVMAPPSASTMFLAMARPRPGARPPGREVGLEDVRQVGGGDADAAVLRPRWRRRRRRRRGVAQLDVGGAGAAPRRRGPPPPRRALERMLTSAVRRRSPSVTTAGQRGVEVERDRRGAVSPDMAAAAASRHSGVEVGGRRAPADRAARSRAPRSRRG